MRDDARISLKQIINKWSFNKMIELPEYTDLEILLSCYVLEDDFKVPYLLYFDFLVSFNY